MAKGINKSSTKRDIQARQRVWLLEVLEKTRLKASQMAIKAGISDSTITRLINNDEYTGTLSPETIERIKQTYDVPGPDEAARFDPLLEARPLALDDMAAAQRAALTALIGDRSGVEAWTVHGNALQAAGVLPGDVLLVDMAEVPRAGDIVCAEIHEQGVRRTVFRVYQKPYLVPATFAVGAWMPIVVDDRNVIVRGVVTDRLSSHRSVSAAGPQAVHMKQSGK